MAERRSRSIDETRDKEAWLVHLLEGDAGERKELASLLRVAAMARAAMNRIEVPPNAEEESRQRALAELGAGRGRQAALPPRASWLTRFGSTMRFVFTLGRRR